MGAGELYFLQDQSPTGRPYFLKALALARELNAYDRLQEIYLFLCRTDSVLAAFGQPACWKAAQEYKRLHRMYRDSVMKK